MTDSSMTLKIGSTEVVLHRLTPAPSNVLVGTVNGITIEWIEFSNQLGIYEHTDSSGRRGALWGVHFTCYGKDPQTSLDQLFPRFRAEVERVLADAKADVDMLPARIAEMTAKAHAAFARQHTLSVRANIL